MEIIAAAIYGISYAYGGENALYFAVVISALLIVSVVYFLKNMGTTKVLNELVLSDKSTSDKGYTSAEWREYLIGKQGIVAGELRPAGTVIIDKNPVDVVSEGSFIKKGEIVKVVAVNGNRVVVRKADDI